MKEITWSPQDEIHPNMRDMIAIHEGSVPLAIVRDAETMAKYIGVPVSQFRMETHFCKVLAKWRYQVADAMLEEKEKRQ
ncbi:MAG: hypothetical protein WC100_03515 [Sterolibacterium sp.]